MTAKQTLQSASLVALLAASPDFAHAEPDAPLTPPSEVHPEPAKPRHEPTGTFEIGAGFSTEESFIAGARIAQNNLFGTGDRLALTARLAQHRQQLAAMFEDPHLLGSTLSLRADVFSDRNELYGFSREATGASLTLSQELAPHLRGFAGYGLQTVTVEPPPGSNGPTAQTYRLATLRLGLEYSTLDAPFLPTRGTSVGSSITIADRSLGSEVQMIRTDAWASHHRPIGPLTLHLGGSVSTVSDGTPLGERLQFDGSSDIRGFALGQLGPRDRNGTSLGGTLKYTARAELEAPLIKSAGLSVAGFVDTGGLMTGLRGWSGTSAGVGLIWRSPIGPLRFDWAVPIDGGRPSFVFSMGGGF